MIRYSKSIGVSMALVACALLASNLSVYAFQYNSQTQVTSSSLTVPAGGIVRLTATVQPGCPPFEPCSPFTGTVTWDDGDVGGVFNAPSCTYTRADNLSIGICTTGYTTPAVPEAVAIQASYSGNSNYSSSMGGITIQVTGSTSSTTTSSTSLPASGGTDFVQLLGYAGAAAAVVLVLFVALRRRKSL